MRLLWFNLATDLDDPILGFTTRWIEAVAEKVDFIHVITMRAGRVEVPENVEVYSVGKEKGFSEPRRAWEFYRILLRILKTDKIDACFSHMMPLFTVMAGPILKLKKIPIITWYAHPSVTLILKLAHHLSDKMVASVSTAYPYKHDKLIAIGQGIDTDLFSPDDRVKPDEPPMILCAGRLSPVKDHETLIKAVSILKNKWSKPFKVVILGNPTGPRDEEYVKRLRQLIDSLGLQDIVTIHPAVPMRELPNWYRRCTIHVNLTPTGFGDKVAWEAMACGKACLVANEGFAETLGKFKTTLMFKHGNEDDLFKKLLSWLSLTPDERRRAGLYLSEQVIKLHSLHQLAEKLLLLMKSIKETS